MDTNSKNLSLYRSVVTLFRKKTALALRGDILDVGTGIGDYLPYLTGKVIGLDKDFDILKVNLLSKKVYADASRLPFKSNSFDCVWACAIIQYLHLGEFVKEARRVAKPKGVILILVPNTDSIWDKMKKILGMSTWNDQKGIVKQYSVKELSRFGSLEGEIQFLPFEGIFRNLPVLSHTLMLKIIVEK